MIDIAKVSKNFGKTAALKNIDLKINNGEIVGFAGLNGAGKSTAIRIISGIIFPSSGNIAINGHDIVREKMEASKHIGWVPESPNFEPETSSLSLLKYYAGFYGIKSKDAEIKAEELLKKLNIWDARNKRLSNYSMGMKKRFSIVAAMIGDPDNYLFDETLNGLDPQGVKDMRDLMLEMKKNGKAVFLSSHILSELQNIADRIAIIKNGEIIKIIDRKDLSNLGGTPSINIKIKNSDNNVINLLNKFGETTKNDNIYTIKAPDLSEDDSSKINKYMIDNGYDVISVSYAGEELEEYFLNLVRN